jgi:hypothetical protein
MKNEFQGWKMRIVLEAVLKCFNWGNLPESFRRNLLPILGEIGQGVKKVPTE